MSTENEKNFDLGIMKARAIIMNVLTDKMRVFSDAMLKDAYSLHTDWQSWSGNTQTSYSCGFAVNKNLVEIKSLGESIPAPLIPKIKKGEYRTLKVDYSGRKKQTRVGKVNIVEPYGMPLARKTVQEVTNKLARGIAFRMATGTEYSTFLENNKGWWVLGGSFIIAESRLKSIMGI